MSIRKKVHNYLHYKNGTEFSRLDNIKYNSKRQTIPVTALIVGLLLFWAVGSKERFDMSIEILLSGIQRIGIFVFLFILITKFVFLKISIQEGLNKGNIAIALFFGLLAIALAIAF